MRTSPAISRVLSMSCLRSPDSLDELRQPLRELYETQRARRYLRELLPGDEELRRILAAAEEECLAELSDDGDGS